MYVAAGDKEWCREKRREDWRMEVSICTRTSHVPRTLALGLDLSVDLINIESNTSFRHPMKPSRTGVRSLLNGQGKASVQRFNDYHTN